MTIGDATHREQELSKYSRDAINQMALHWLMMTCIFSDYKIEAIKLRRSATGDGLKEAKDYVEGIQARLKPTVPAPVNSPFALTEMKYKEVLNRLDDLDTMYHNINRKFDRDISDLAGLINNLEKKMKRVNKKAFKDLPEDARNGD